MDGFSVEPAVEHEDAEALEQRAHAVARGDGHRPAAVAHAADAPVAVGAAARRALRSATCACMSATSRRETSPASSNSADDELGLVGVDVDLERGRVADDEDAVAERLERADPLGGLEAVAGDGEVRAVAVGRGLVVRMGDPHRRRRLVGHGAAPSVPRSAATMPAITIVTP